MTVNTPFPKVSATRDRANLLMLIRQFFLDRQVMEVVTPVLGLRSASDPHIESLNIMQAKQRFFLQTSPEFAMKRLLAAMGDEPCPASFENRARFIPNKNA